MAPPPCSRINGTAALVQRKGPGIVDQRVEPAEADAHRRHRRRHQAGIGDVALQRQRIVGGLQRRRRVAQQFPLDVEQRDAPALGEKFLRDAEPDTTRGAGHQRDFLCVCHSRSPPCAECYRFVAWMERKRNPGFSPALRCAPCGLHEV
jgi:hypothetical protein